MTTHCDVQGKFQLWAQPTKLSTPNVRLIWLCDVCHPKKIWQCTKTFLSIVIMVIMTCIISAFLLIGIWILERWASAMSSKGQRGKKSWAAGRARKGEKEEVQARKSQHPLWLGPEGTTCVATRPTITASIFSTITASQLLCRSSLPHLNCSANQQTRLKQFDLVRCWRYIIHAPPRMLLLSFQLKVRRGRIRGREVCRRENCRQLC